MNRNKRAKIMVAAVAFAGAVAVGATAFTASGRSVGGGVNQNQFLGGSASIAVQGTTLVAAAYSYTPADNTMQGVDLTFASSAVGQYVKVVFHRLAGGDVTGVTTGDDDQLNKVGTGDHATSVVTDLEGVTGITVTVQPDAFA